MNNETKTLVSSVIVMQTVVDCPKHGTHPHVIRSSIPNHEGVWCQICWLESIGPALPSRQEPMKFGEQT